MVKTLYVYNGEQIDRWKLWKIMHLWMKCLYVEEKKAIIKSVTTRENKWFAHRMVWVKIRRDLRKWKRNGRTAKERSDTSANYFHGYSVSSMLFVITSTEEWDWKCYCCHLVFDRIYQFVSVSQRTYDWPIENGKRQRVKLFDRKYKGLNGKQYTYNLDWAWIQQKNTQM